MAIQHCVRVCKYGLRLTAAQQQCLYGHSFVDLRVRALTFKFPLTFTYATANLPLFFSVFTKVKVMVIGWRGECLT